MKRWTALLLCLLLSLPGLSPAEEAEKVIYASPGDIIEVELALTADSDRPDLLVGQLSYHPDALEPQLSRALTAQGTVYMYNGVPVTIRFRVRDFVPEGEYVVSCEVLEAAKREGKVESGVAIAPVKVVVGAAGKKTAEAQVQIVYVDNRDNQVLYRTAVTMSEAGRIYYDPAAIPDGYNLAGDRYADVTVTDGKAEPGSVVFFVAPAATPTPAPTAAPTRKPYPAVGQYIRFGRYPQTAEGTDETPIDWLVLEVDKKNHKALLLSRYGLDAKQYNASRTDITWETCTLRAWLNGEFMNRAFNAEEQLAIELTNVDNSRSQGYSGWSTSGGNNTQDKVFLLSNAEANKYLGVQHHSVNGSEKNLKSRVAPTAYAVKRGAYTNSDYKTTDGVAVGWWWLRSPGFNRNYAACVLTDGSLFSSSVHDDRGCVRPALWVNLESDIF